MAGPGRALSRLTRSAAIRPREHAIPIEPTHSHLQFRNHKLVYRRYAGLFFSFCVDANDNELVWLEAIHMFVEVLGASLFRVSLVARGCAGANPDREGCRT